MQEEEKQCWLYNKKRPLVYFASKKSQPQFFFYKIHSLFELVSSYKGLAKDPKTAYKDISLIKIRTNTYIKN